MNNVEKELKNISLTLGSIQKLIQQLIAIQLYNSGATQDEVSKSLKIAKGSVNKMLRGIKKEQSSTNAKH